MNENNRIVKIFISSTFREMADERDEIQQIAFTKIRFWARKLGINVIPIDLRWGITHEDIVEGKLARQCEEAIQACKPYFIALLGNTYGTDTKSVLGDVEKKYLGKSVTDYEITKGVLEINNSKSFIYNIVYSNSKEKLHKRIKLNKLKKAISQNTSLIDVNIRERLISNIVNDIEAMLLEEFSSALAQDSLSQETFYLKSSFYSQYYNSFFDQTYFSRYIDFSEKRYLVSSSELDSIHYFMYNLAYLINSNQKYNMLYHDFRISTYSRSLDGFLNHLIDSIYHQLGKYFYSCGDIIEDALTAVALYNESNSDKGLVVFIDSLYVLSNSSTSGIINFLHTNNLTNVTFVVSSFDHCDYFSDSFSLIELNELTEHEAASFFSNYLHEYKKDNNDKLTNEIITHLLNSKSYDISFLQLTLNEILLRGCPSKSILSEIDKLTSTSSPTEMMTLIIKRILNTLTDRQNSDKAAKMICILLSLANEYLFLKDIEDILIAEGFSHASITECLELLNDLVSVCDNRYQFRFTELKDAVKSLFSDDIGNIDDKIFYPHFKNMNTSLHSISELEGYYLRHEQINELIECYFDKRNFQLLFHEDVTKLINITTGNPQLLTQHICKIIEAVPDNPDYDYQNLVSFLIMCGYYDMAENLLDTLMSNDDSNVLWKLEKGYLYRETGCYDQSISTLLPLLDNLKDTTGSSIKAYDYLSYCFGKTNNTSQSVFFAQKAIKMRKDNPTKYEMDLPVSLNSLAYNYYREGKHLEAINLYEESCAIRIKYFGTEHPRVANNLNNIGKVYLRQNRIDEAYSIFEKSHAILSRVMGETHNYTLIVYMNCLVCEYILHHLDPDTLIEKITATKKTLEKRMNYNDYLAYADTVHALFLSQAIDKTQLKALLDKPRDYYSKTFGNECYEVAFIDNLVNNPGKLEGIF